MGYRSSYRSEKTNWRRLYRLAKASVVVICLGIIGYHYYEKYAVPTPIPHVTVQTLVTDTQVANHFTPVQVVEYVDTVLSTANRSTNEASVLQQLYKSGYLQKSAYQSLNKHIVWTPENIKKYGFVSTKLTGLSVTSKSPVQGVPDLYVVNTTEAGQYTLTNHRFSDLTIQTKWLLVRPNHNNMWSVQEIQEKTT